MNLCKEERSGGNYPNAKKLKRKESKRQLKISDEAKVFNEYIVVVINLVSWEKAEKSIGFVLWLRGILEFATRST